MGRFRCSETELLDFVESKAWMDIHDFLVERQKALDSALRHEDDDNSIHRLQGAAKELEFMLQLPEAMVNELAVERKLEGRNAGRKD